MDNEETDQAVAKGTRYAFPGGADRRRGRRRATERFGALAAAARTRRSSAWHDPAARNLACRGTRRHIRAAAGALAPDLAPAVDLARHTRPGDPLLCLVGRDAALSGRGGLHGADQRGIGTGGDRRPVRPRRCDDDDFRCLQGARVHPVPADDGLYGPALRLHGSFRVVENGPAPALQQSVGNEQRSVRLLPGPGPGGRRYAGGNPAPLCPGARLRRTPPASAMRSFAPPSSM